MLKGIDVSGYQEDSIFEEMNPDFAIIKATEGVGYVSDGFERLIKAWVKYNPEGLTGFYHYAHPETGNTPESEVKAFLNACAAWRTPNDIVALDWENKALYESPQWAYQWLWLVADRLGTIPFIYMSATVTRQKGWDKVASVARLWVAHYGVSKPVYETWDNWSLWQYTDTPCDQDYFPAGKQAWINLAHGRNSTPKTEQWTITSQTDKKIILELK